jgi:hypothetical protein
MEKRRITINSILILTIAIIFVWWGLGALSILGPLDHPYFEKKDWQLLQVRYFLITTKGEISRLITIDDHNTLVDLKNEFITDKSEGMSIPHPGIIFLRLSNGQEWKINFSLPNRLGISKKDDDYYSYSIVLKNTKFYCKLRELCLKKEQHLTPLACLENIKICTGGLGEIQEKTRPLNSEIIQ